MTYTLNGTEFETATEAVASLVPDYATIPADDEYSALIARYDYAVKQANELQRDYLLEGDPLPEEDADVALIPKHEPVVDVEVWDLMVPLVLIATDYTPYTDLEAPQGNVIMLNPADELSFLVSLERADLIGFSA